MVFFYFYDINLFSYNENNNCVFSWFFLSVYVCEWYISINPAIIFIHLLGTITHKHPVTYDTFSNNVTASSDDVKILTATFTPKDRCTTSAGQNSNTNANITIAIIILLCIAAIFFLSYIFLRFRLDNTTSLDKMP